MSGIPSRIHAMRFCCFCGSAQFPLQEGRRRCAGCGHEEFNNPIVAVAVWIRNAAGDVLLIERAKDPGKGKLAPPGGFVDPGEGVEEAARREVSEEVGLHLNDLEYIHSAPNLYPYRGTCRPVCDVFFQAQVDSFAVEIDPMEERREHIGHLDAVVPEDLAFDSVRASFFRLRADASA